jgi:hypothetical protein
MLKISNNRKIKNGKKTKETLQYVLCHQIISYKHMKTLLKEFWKGKLHIENSPGRTL